MQKSWSVAVGVVVLMSAFAMASAEEKPAVAAAQAESPQFLLIIQESDAAFRARTDPKLQAQYWGAFAAYGMELAKAGVLVSGNALEVPATASTVRVRQGKREVQKEALATSGGKQGGYFVIRAANLDAALEWAAKCPAAAEGAIEVRPIQPTSPAMAKR